MIRIIACVLAAAALFAIKDQFWPLAWFVAVPLLWVAYSARSIRVPIIAAISACLLVGLPALTRWTLAMGFVVLPMLLVQISAAMGAIVLSLMVARVVHRRLGPIASILAYPLAWTGLAYFCMLMLGGDAATISAHTQMDVPLLVQSAALFGLWGVEFLVALFANGIALLLYERRCVRVYAGVPLIAVLMAVVFGYAHLRAGGEEKIRVAAAAQDLRLNARLPVGRDQVLLVAERYAAEVRALAAQGAKVVVLPELTSILMPEWRDDALSPIAQAANETGASITIGYGDIDSAQRVHNIALTFTPNAEPVAYIKRHPLVPLDQSIRGTEPGTLRDGRGVAICKDLDFPATIRSDAALGLRLMLVPAADFEDDGWSHARMALFRSVENGFAMVRAARNGVITISDDRGRVLARAASVADRTTHVIADVPLGSGRTVYQRFGDFFAWGCFGGTLALVLPALRRKDVSRQADIFRS